MCLIAIPYAFGNANIYCDLFKNLDSKIKTKAVEYSGHGRRFNEELNYKMEDVVEDVFEQIKSVIDSEEEYCLLGYSMGGLVAYELYFRIFSAGMKLPEHIFIMGTPDPCFEHKKADFESYNLEQIKHELTIRGGTEEELLQNEEMIELLSPIVKADNIVLRDYVYKCKKESVRCDVTVIRGTKEDALENCQKGWEVSLGREIEYILIEGEHFFLFEDNGKNRDEIIRIIEKKM